MSSSAGLVVKNPPANAGNMSSIPGSGRSPGEGNGNPLQCSCLENPRDGRAWWATVYGVAQSWTRLKRLNSRSSMYMGLPRWLSGKESACQCRRCEFSPWVGKIFWRRKRQPTPIFLPGESHGQRSLVSYSPWGPKESDMS